LEYFSEIPEMKLPPEMMKLAQHIIRTKSADFDSAMLEDHYRSALVRILRRKQAKRPAGACNQAVTRERRQPHGRSPAKRRRRAPGKAYRPQEGAAGATAEPVDPR
jgi:non-homologous end joining protein Ku